MGDRDREGRWLARQSLRLGIRAIEQPLVYRLSQAPLAERKFAPILRHNDLSRVAHVLDVGCGPGTNAHHFPATGYLGLDINPAYVEYARKRHGRNFVVADLADHIPTDGSRPDFVLVNSFLHHVDDEDVRKILSRLSELMAADGRLHVLELVLPRRPSLARLLARLDRGAYARPLERWHQLFSERFEPLIFERYRLGVAGMAFWNMVYFKGRARVGACAPVQVDAAGAASRARPRVSPPRSATTADPTAKALAKMTRARVSEPAMTEAPKRVTRTAAMRVMALAQPTPVARSRVG